MANATTGSVIFVDTTAYQGVGPCNIKAIKYIGNASGTATIKSDSSGGQTLWEEGGANNVFNGSLDIRTNDIYVTLTNGAKVYIYLCAD